MDNMYKKILEIDLKHEKYACSSDLDIEEEITEQERIYRNKKLTFNQVVEEINKNSEDLPPNKKRCVLCDTIVTGKPYIMGYCDCNFLKYDHDYDTGKYSRYLLDYDRIKHPDTIED